MKKLTEYIALVLCLNVSYLFSSWDISYETDPMSSEKSAYATSSSTLSVKRMSFPYANTKSWVGISCDKQNQWVSISFSNVPNLSGTEIIVDGYNTIKTRVKFDETLDRVTFIQRWGSKFLHVSTPDTERFLEKFKKSSSFLLELDWYGNGNVYFNYDIINSSKSINKIMDYCKKL